MPPRPPNRQHRRPANAREAAAAPSSLPPAVGAALDVIARIRGDGSAPLDAVVAGVARERGAGARDRRALGDLVFAWARRRAGIEPRLREALAGRGGLRVPPRDLDRVTLAAAAKESDLELTDDVAQLLGPELNALLDDVLALPAPPLPLPPWLLARLGPAFGDELPALVAALGTRALPVLAVDTRRVSIDEVQAALAETGAVGHRSPLVPRALRVDGKLRLHALPPRIRDVVWPMDDGSQAVALALGAQPGELVLDACAGGGGKSRLLTALGAHVIAADLSRPRLARSLAKKAEGIVADMASPPFRPGTFARILIDAPCSGIGTLRRAPDVAHRLTPADVDAAVRMQRAILAGVIPLLAPGGTLVYATCSLLPEENDGVVQHAMRSHPGLAPKSLASLWGDSVTSGTDPAAATRTFLPSREGTDGFFVAAFTRAR